MANCPMCGEVWNEQRCAMCGWYEGKQPRYTEPRSGWACPSCYVDTAQPPREFCKRRDLHEAQ
jgi:hypothetical protein